MPRCVPAVLAFLLLAAVLPGTGLAASARGAKAAAAKPTGASDPSAPAAGRLNQDAVRLLYSDGEFDRAIAILEEFQKSQSTWTREESLMVYKYLGVMYCADQGTREKGKSYFYKLLKIDPEARILDMYVSIMVQEIFKSTLDELMGLAAAPGTRTAPAAEADPALAAHAERRRDQGPTPAPKEEPKPRKGGSTWLWWAGGLGLAAGAAAGYVVYAQSSGSGKATEKNIPVGF